MALESAQKTYTLNTGTTIRAVSFGTFQSEASNAGVQDAVLAALEAGYRQIDTAYAYGNEKEVGEAIRKSGIARQELFIITKLAQAWHRPEDVELAIDESLRSLGLDYGLSNFNILKTKRILENATIIPAINQVELHPYLPQKELLKLCNENGIHLMAHQPLGGNPVGVVAPQAHILGPLKDPKILEIASRNHMTPAQVLLSWAVQRGTSVVPKSVRPERIRSNLQIFRLSDEDFNAVDNLKSGAEPVRYLDPRFHIGFDLFSEEADEPVGGGDVG